ncbi:MAG: transposase [Pseudonocardiaceae bacterium]
MKTIYEIHTELGGYPGARRVWTELVMRGVRVGPKRVWRLSTRLACADGTRECGRRPPSQLSGLSMRQT